MTNWGWRTTTYVVTTMWKWYLLHPVLGRATAYIAPSVSTVFFSNKLHLVQLVPVFYAAYSSLFVTFSFGWEVTLLFLGQHAAFYAAAASHFPSLCYVAAIVIHCQKFVLPYDPFELVPVFYAAYSSLFVTFSFGWEVTLLFLGQHAAFYAAAASHFPSLCYVAAIVIHCQKFVLPYDPFEYMYPRYGLMPYRAAFVAFHWNLMRGLSFSLDFVRAKRQKHSDENKSRWPPYWQSLAYFIYLPTMYLGPPQNYDDFVAELNKTRAPCTPRVIAGAIGRLLRSGAHFFLMELLGHFLYSSAMSEWPWIGERLDLFSLVGYALSLLFLFYMRYRFTYGFAGALANAEGVEVPPHSPCIAIMHRCSHFWRYFDRGMHKWIRRYIYEPVVAGRRRAFRLVLGTAVAFTFTWVWHSMYMHDGIWCALSVLGIALEVITMEARKWTPIKNFEGRYLASAERMRVAKAFLGSPHFLLTICACIFHLAELEVCLIICRRVLTGFPFPIVPILVVLYSACHVALDVAEWEASAIAKQKQASS
ncbi:hypothetical protein HPB49_012581 [Dermacentor silvarum]|uniref:Uncharacterized protein n=1 Tax=Dermacentor silvarum TaxID=543639 RepID=A0ACB8CF42_DERSI|nr:hypothetical protein HPB49_012581 [Dermacentor silvarum]